MSRWSDIRGLFVRHAEAFVNATRYEEASAIADNAAREIEDLAASPQPVVGDRETVARLIEPNAWMAKDVNPDWSVISLTRKVSAPDAVRLSLDKADAILASLSSRPEGNQELCALRPKGACVPGGDGDGGAGQ